MLRRAFATLVALLTLNVSAAEALRVCASEATHDDSAAAESSQADHHQHHSASVPAEPHEDCEGPTETPSSCCDALSSCGTTLSIDGAAGEAEVMTHGGSLAGAAERAPRSLNGSPEPPPPKG